MTTGRRGQETIDAALDAALACATAEERLTVAGISARSKVSVGSLYHHFGSLDGLRRALFSRCMHSLLDTLIDAVEPETTVEDVTRALCTAYLGWTRDHAEEARFLHFSLQDGLGAEVVAAKAPRMARLYAVLGRFADELAPLSPPLFELLLIGPLAELARRWLLGAPGFSLEEATLHLPPQLAAAVRAPPAAQARQHPEGDDHVGS